MRHINEKIEGPFLVSEDTALHGMITVEAVVRPGVTFIVHGMITGDLGVKEGAQAVVHGSVNGLIQNHGRVHLYGVADGLTDVGPSARSVLDPKAVIKKPLR